MTGFYMLRALSSTTTSSTMDVTAMLNTSAEVDGQSKLEDTTGSPFRTRTPWDAGGYSLPIHIPHLGPFRDDAFPNDSIMDNHTIQPRHKLSDSHSSLSSFASSNSISHSRFSSMSTVHSLQLPSQTISETLLTDSEMSSHSSKTATGSCSPASPRTGRSTSQSSSSPALYSSSLAPIVERHFYGSPTKESVDHLFIVTELAKECDTDAVDGTGEGIVSTTSPRPASPSDAILIKRTTPPVFPYRIRQPRIVESGHSHINLQTSNQENAIKDRDQESDRLSISPKGHKRAVSAPDFPGSMAESLKSGCTGSTQSDHIVDVSPSSLPLETSLPAVTATDTDAITTLEVVPTPLDQRPCCMYISNCDTGSQLRKAVSHIFGRNKMCTRRIPPHVWVWYCRKHYQRARYRNAKEWARTLQYDLVSRQIKRLQEWSEENLRTGGGGIVQDYKLAIRKREQRRLDAQKPKAERECSDSEADETSELQGDASSSTAVPDWLLNLSGRSHDARRIIEIIDGIQADLTANNLSAWPDIEILPNIVLEQDESETTKACTKRRAISGAHGRSQSLGSTARIDEESTNLWESQERVSPINRQYLPGVNPQKRKRSNDREEENDVQSIPQSQRIRVNERQVDTVGQGPHPAQRPVFRGFGENQGAEESFGNTELRSDYHTACTDAHTLPVAAPSPRRFASLPTAAYIDPSVPSTDGSYSVTRRGLHKRSLSDMGGLHNYQSPSRIPNRHRHQNTAPVYHESQAPRHFWSTPNNYTSLSNMESPLQRERAHTRHQSTPIVPLGIRRQVMSSTGYHALPRMPSSSPSFSRDMNDSVRGLRLLQW